MKAKSRRQSSAAAAGGVSAGVRPLEIVFVFLPFLALLPNFFEIPRLYYPGLATQEVVYSWAAAAVAALAGVAVLRARGPLRVSRQALSLFAPLALFCLWQGASLLWAVDWAEGVRVAGIWLGFGVFLAAGYATLRPRVAGWVALSLKAVILVLAVSQLIEYAEYGSETRGVFFSHGITSEMLALLLPLAALTYLSARKRWLTILSLAAAGLGGVAVLLTLRRGPLLGLLVALIGIGVALLRGWVRPPERWRLIAAAAAVVIIGGASVVYRGEQLLERLRGAVEIQQATGSGSAELGLTSRAAKWIVAWEMGKRHLLLGVGNGGYSADYGGARRAFVENPRYARIAAASEAEDFDEIRSPQAHNEFLQVFAELGIVGCALFAAFWAQVVWQLWRRRRAPGNDLILGALFGLIAFGVSSAVSAFSFRYTPGAITAACVLAVGLALARAAEAEAEPAPPPVSLPKAIAAVAVAVALVPAVWFAWRAQQVLASQQAQSRLDFEVNLTNPGANELLLARYRRVLALDPENAGARLGVGLLLYQMRRINESIPHVEYALSHGYSRPFTYVMLAFDYEQAGDLGRATRVLADCVASFPKSIFARAAYAELLRKQGEAARAEEQERIMEAAEPRAARSWGLALRVKDSDAAAAEAKRLGLISPDELAPLLAKSLVRARAYHYLR